MSGFKGTMESEWLFGQEVRLFGNFMRNWEGEVQDSDFFILFGDDGGEEKSLAKAMLLKHYSREELAECDDVWVRDRNGDGKEEIDLRRGVKSAVADVWNHFGKAGRERCRSMLEEWLAEVAKRHGRGRSGRKKDALEGRVDEVCKVLSLGETERDLLVYAVVRQMTDFDDFPSSRHSCRHGERGTWLAMAVDRPCGAVARALSSEGKLRKYEVLDGDGDLMRGPFQDFLVEGGGGLLEGQFYEKAKMEEVLPWGYFGRLAREHGELLKRLLGRADGRKGVHILLYGAPGTGKTSFAKALAREAGRELYEIRQGDREGGRMSAQSRMSGLRICSERVPAGRSMALVDEADELLRTNRGFFGFFGLPVGGGGTEKGVVNSLLDETRVPTVWISNSPAEALDESVRRRFDYSVRFGRLGERQRRAIWDNNIEKFGLGKVVSPEMAGEFARKYPASAGGIAMVLGNVRRVRPRKGEVAGLVERLMRPHCELTGVREGDGRMAPARDYSLEGLNIRGEVGLERVVAAVRRFREGLEEDGGEGDLDRPRMNLLLWGLPGTGKTEFVKYLGREVGARVVAKSGSDLLSMWVGGTERNIRAAFEEAEEERSILFLDEIDGLVQNRAGAERSWEVTQVNELLQRMENFKGVMVAATNFMDNLDPAVLRRFTFKFQFDYLEEEGKRVFFERMFRTRLEEGEAARLAGIPRLAPGDFRTARQSLHYLGGEVTNAMRLDALERESALKKGERRGGKVGF
jgi:SpoVK/Ycf46/Vps4 family AAA+-type ATPase